MIEFRTLPDDHPDLACSPLLRVALLTLQYVQEYRAIGLTKTMVFRRVFVHWAVAHFTGQERVQRKSSASARSSNPLRPVSIQ